MFVPLHDENTLKSIRFQWVTIILIAINVVVYFFEAARLDEVAIAGFALIPRELFDTSLLPIPVESVGPPVPERLTLLTYMFFHGDILHLAGNMLFLWVFRIGACPASPRFPGGSPPRRGTL
jgi:membrane associated rhomboid family serine protease